MSVSLPRLACRRSALFCALALLTVLVGLAPRQGVASRAGTIEPALLRAAKAHPAASFHVFIVGRGLDEAAARGSAQIEMRFPVLHALVLRVRGRDLARLVESPGIVSVRTDAPVVQHSVGPISFLNLATNFPRVDTADAAWMRGLDGRGVGIAVIDSGTTPSPAFGSRLIQIRLPGQSNSLDDMVGHGSLVAGVAAGRSPDGRFVGIAPGATVYAINVARPAGLFSSDVIAGLVAVLGLRDRYNIRVVVLSLSELTPAPSSQSLLNAAVELLWKSGIVVVASSGNGGPGTATVAPGNDPLVITVGATDTMGTLDSSDDMLAPFTSTGPTLDGRAKPDLLAPGRHIASVLAAGSLYSSLAPITNLLAPGYATISGTSFSAPQVAGAVALLLQKNPAWTPDQVKYVLTRTGRSTQGGSIPALDIAAALNANPFGAPVQISPIWTSSGSDSNGQLGDGQVSNWDSSSWNSSSWNSSSWNSSSWNSSSWNSSSWNSSSWNLSSWDQG